MLFLERAGGEVVVDKAELAAVTHAQAAFAGLADDFGVTDEANVQALVDELRVDRSRVVSCWTPTPPSSLLFLGSTPDLVLRLVLDKHDLVLTNWIITELHEVAGRKCPDLLPALAQFLDGIDPEVAPIGSPGVRAIRLPTPRARRRHQSCGAAARRPAAMPAPVPTIQTGVQCRLQRPPRQPGHHELPKGQRASPDHSSWF